ncbi:MAG: tetratricopeptide repeat protein [Deltaproteobacteria bacterium]|nr:tetratricopeptide repeat protein [Deltaproteobacteria bacterium]
MDPVLAVVLVVVSGTVAVYGPIAAGSWLMRKRRLLDAWRSEPAQLPPRRRMQYARLLFQEAVKAHQAADHDKTAETCRRVLRFESEDPQASRLLVASLFAAGRFNDTQQALERHLQANPHDEAAKLVRAAIYCETDDLPAALDALKAIDPEKLPTADRALWYNNYAFTLAGLATDLDQAREFGEKALDLASQADRQFALRTLGVVHLRRKEPDIAVERLEVALKERQHLRPGDVEFTRYYLALAYLELQQEKKARDQLSLISGGRTMYAEKAKQSLVELNQAA